MFVKGYELLSFAKNMSKNISNNTSKNISINYNQKLLHHAEQSATDALTITSKRVIKKTAGTTGDLIGNKIADTIKLLIQISSPQNTYGTVKNGTKTIRPDREIRKEIYTSPEKRQFSLNLVLKMR